MNDLTPFTPLDGGCRCGAVRFRLEAAPIITHSCHCRFCQKVSGAPFRTNAMIETEHLTILAGAPQPFHGRDCMKTLRCPSCEITLWCHHPHLGDVIALVGVGTLDEGERLAPEAHYFVRSKHPWITLPPDVPAFETLGDPGKASARERIVAALARSPAKPPMAAWTEGPPAT